MADFPCSQGWEILGGKLRPKIAPPALTKVLGDGIVNETV